MRNEARPWQTFIPVKIPFLRVGRLSEYGPTLEEAQSQIVSGIITSIGLRQVRLYKRDW